MSAGPTIFVGVNLPGTQVARIRIQEETDDIVIGGVTNAGVANPTGAADRILVSAGRRRRGVLIAGRVRFRFVGEPPDGYAEGSTLSLPILSRAFLEACTEGATGTYLATPIVCAGASSPVGFTYR